MTKKNDPSECNCSCHGQPGIMHCVPSCDKSPHQATGETDAAAEHIQHLLARQAVNESSRFNQHGIIIGQIMIGHFVKAKTSNGNEVQGVVKGVFNDQDQVDIHTGATEHRVGFENILAVAEPKTVFESIRAGLLEAISQSENKN